MLRVGNDGKGFNVNERLTEKLSKSIAYPVLGRKLLGGNSLLRCI